ncbi:arginine/serine-rich protein PNISR-like [Lingula anatina]|uniref:Arginine/serine-rich protein PNISR-like n=1 Tax=Lingula anatina TaxID=7574 RepID=A0A1S3J1V3_LINAN|nr:arginine/serine-rich protein PNISR-like [Lingula anatina]|eukprot:XP_013403804.1 arginine/serine-rich protein PNISR-like [Lingula anatina]
MWPAAQGGWGTWPIQQAAYQHIPHEQVDWAALAKQWISQKDNLEAAQQGNQPVEGNQNQAAPPDGGQGHAANVAVENGNQNTSFSGAEGSYPMGDQNQMTGGWGWGMHGWDMGGWGMQGEMKTFKLKI